MGESKRRVLKDPLYGLQPKEGPPPTWFVHRGVLVLVSVDGNTMSFHPAAHMRVLNSEQEAEIDRYLDSNLDMLYPAEVGNSIESDTTPSQE